jgi:MFS transporter, ACS family, glucarate transporter
MAARHKLIAVTFTLTTLLYVDRIAISAAKTPITGEFGLSDTQFGWVLSAFALGYALFQVPAGLLADKYGPRIVLATIVALWSAFTGLTGLVWGFVTLIICRFLFGMAEAGAFPNCARAIYMWLPAGERGLAQGINFSGSRLGAAFALPGIAWLLTVAGWRAAFLILGAVGVLWAIGWYVWFRDAPEDHRAVSAQERALIVTGRGESPDGVHIAISARSLWRSRNVRLMMGQYFASNFTFFFCLTWLFPYLQKTYGLDVIETGLLSALPLLGGAAGNWIGGFVVDRLYRRGLVVNSRRYPAIFGFVLAAVGLAGSMFAGSAIESVAWLTLVMVGADMTLPPSWAYCIDVGGKHSGAVSGMMNMAGNLGSFVTSLAFPYLLAASGSTASFFVVGAALNLVAALLWFRSGSKSHDGSQELFSPDP